jgi:2'-5' RNA ligase
MEPADGQGKLMELVDRLRAALKYRGFPIEQRPFRAHLTLAREVGRFDVNSDATRAVRWPVDRIELVESTVAKKGSLYTVVTRRK